ncbi:MAG: hypothetical protein LBG15_01935 [Dysgonamonadaceae bacterium]|jgi:hypothetical protein|nr:hypothetical protein [Dysgonamonadaceae bacterium]
MRNIKTSLWLLITLFVVSCAQEEGALYENPDGIISVSLASSKYSAELAPEDGTEITVQVQRNNAKGTFNAPFSFKSSSTLFTMSDTIAHFADGNAITYLTISFPGSEQMSLGDSYQLTVSLFDAKMLSAGGIQQQTLTFKRRLTWVDAGTGQWTEGLIVPIFVLPVLTYDVAVQKAEEADGVYRLVNPYGYEVYEYTEEGDVVTDPCYVMINAIDADKVVIPETGIGIDWGYGEFFVASLSGRYGTRSGKTITFPAQTLAVGMRNYNSGSLSFYAEECILVLP